MNYGILLQSKYLLIEQQDDWAECFFCQWMLLTCCENSNKYLIWKCEDEYFQQVDRQLGDFIEESSLCCRCTCITRRSFSGGLSIGGVQIATSEVPYKCQTCNFLTCCCMKPEMRVSLSQNYIGKIVQPYYGPCWGTRNKLCCPIMELQVFNQSDELAYTITGKCCQKSVCCLPFQCCGCKIIKYEIRDASNEFAGTIQNLYNGYIRECCTRQDKFGITFDNITSPKDKILLIKATLWLDYLQYQA
ncbi:hypothetical protein ABPG72_020957 [Tetrahymena utriculariae]